MSNSELIIVGLSGGVDSAVSALLLQRQGFRVEGLFMNNWEDDDTPTACNAERDLADARQVCETLDIPLHQVNFAAQYRAQVFEYCLEEFRAGRTPNPDVHCNERIKFRAFLDHARRLGADRIATGHYARVVGSAGRQHLCRALDSGKDQTYFLYRLSQWQLERAVFPLADLDKGAVRAIADEAGFDNFDKKDSTGICFIGERDFGAFLRRYIATDPGEIVTDEGNVVGTHQGLAFYTVGQRRGLQLGGKTGFGAEPWYVIDKDLSGNRLVVVQGQDHPALYSEALVAGRLHWIAGRVPAAPRRLLARTRHRQPLQACTLEAVDQHAARIRFDRAQRAVTPGQSVVLYAGEECIGGGIIEQRITMPARQQEYRVREIG